MRNIVLPFTLLTVAVFSLPAIHAQAAGAARTFVSAAGSDSNNCTNVATPCRHLATAFAATAQDGEIYVLDPANYGSLTITHGVSIEGHGWASIAPVSGQAALTINAVGATDKINIIGVVLDGTAVGFSTGILFNSGGSLNVRDSVVRNFTMDGIDMFPSAGTVSFVITDTVVSDNHGSGIFYGPDAVSGKVVIDHVEANNNNGGGITILDSGGSSSIAISNSIASNNSDTGISIVSSSSLTVSIDNTTMSGNPTGLGAEGTPLIFLGRSVINSNNTGINNGTSPNSIFSYQDNRINANNPDIGGSGVLNSRPVR